MRERCCGYGAKSAVRPSRSISLVESGQTPTLFGVDPPKPRIEAVRIVDMTSSNAWAEFAAIFSRTRSAHLEHEQAKDGAQEPGAG
jgi:hypothetical protein